MHNYFYLNPLEGEYFIDGFRYAWDDGIFSIALGPVFDKVDGYRLAYFHALSRYFFETSPIYDILTAPN